MFLVVGWLLFLLLLLLLIYIFWFEILNQKHFQVDLEAFSKSFDVHFCVSLHNSLIRQSDGQGEVFQRHHKVSGAQDLPKINRLVLLHP